MILVSLFTKFRAAAALVAATGSLLGAAPAFANSAATADIAAPLRAAQAAKQSQLGSSDEEFRQLFANWQSLDKSPAATATTSLVSVGATSTGLRTLSPPLSSIAPTMSQAVSIPSRMPVDGVMMTSDYGMRWHPVTGGRHQHKGVDLAGPVGTPVHATADGTIGRADWFSSYGLYVAIEHGGNLETRYGHMSRLNVAAGQRVRKGDVIGFIGSTGRSTGPHLHYEVRVAGAAVNPIPYMHGSVSRPAAAFVLAVAASDAGDDGE